MKALALGAFLAIGVAGASLSSQAALAVQDEAVTITGCVVKGEGGYVLLPLPEQGGAGAMLPPAGTSGSTSGTTGATDSPAGTMRVLYWLDDDDEVDDHAGQRVQITGDLDDDIDKGEISVEREDDGTVELEFKHDGKTIQVKLPDVPSTVGTAGSITDKEKDYEFAVRKINVKSVKTLASTCQ